MARPRIKGLLAAAAAQQYMYWLPVPVLLCGGSGEQPLDTGSSHGKVLLIGRLGGVATVQGGIYQFKLGKFPDLT